jgi:hypothetical protein
MVKEQAGAACCGACSKDNGWISARTPPQSDGPRDRPITVFGVIDDPRLKVNGDGPFADVVSYWPAAQRWTVTHQCRADAEAIDFPVQVRAWQRIPDLMPAGSALWD